MNDEGSRGKSTRQTPKAAAAMNILHELAELLSKPFNRSNAELCPLVQESDVQVARIDWGGSMAQVCERVVEAAHKQGKVESLCETLLLHDDLKAYHSEFESWRKLWRDLPIDARFSVDDVLILFSGTYPFPHIVSPSSLLVARYGVIPFTGREKELSHLDEWADSAHSVRVRLIHGEGGTGKTRLAVEWTKKRRDKYGDRAGFLPDLEEASRERLLNVDSAIAVIDYAESQRGLGPLLDSLAWNRVKGRLRILMLARKPGDWLQALKGRSPEVGALLDEIRYLNPLCGETLAERESEYRRALPYFRDQIVKKEIAIEDQGRPAADDMPDFSQRRYERVLYLHMAALAKVMGLKLTQDPYGLLNEILNHESRLWTKRVDLDRADDDERRDFVEQAEKALAMVTLRGPMSRDRFEKECCGLIPDAGLRRKLGRLFIDLYPTDKGYIGALEPDLLGEGLVLRVSQKGEA